MAFSTALATTFDTPSPNIVATYPSSPAPVLGDALWAVISQDGVSQTITPPSGWVERVSQNITYDSQIFKFFDYTGGAPSSAPALTWQSTAANAGVIIIGSNSGRTLARTFTQPSVNNSGNASPITMSATGGTAASGDDLIVIYCLDPDTQTDGSRTISVATGSPGTFTRRINQNHTWTDVSISTIDNVAAGATGNISATGTLGAGLSGWAAFVIAYAASASPPAGNTAAPINNTFFSFGSGSIS